MAGAFSYAVVCAAAHLKGVKAAAYERSGFGWMLLLGRSVRGNPLLFSFPSPALEVSRPIVHLLGFRASPQIPTSDVCLKQASKMVGLRFKIATVSFTMVGSSFNMVGFWLQKSVFCPWKAFPV